MAESQSLDRDDPMPVHYTLNFRDLPTDTSQTISCANEMQAVNLFAAWLVADEENIGYLEAYRDKLYAELKGGKFLP